MGIRIIVLISGVAVVVCHISKSEKRVDLGLNLLADGDHFPNVSHRIMFTIAGRQHSFPEKGSGCNQAIIKFEVMALDTAFILPSFFGNGTINRDNGQSVNKLFGFFSFMFLHSCINLGNSDCRTAEIRLPKCRQEKVPSFFPAPKEIDEDISVNNYFTHRDRTALDDFLRLLTNSSVPAFISG